MEDATFGKTDSGARESIMPVEKINQDALPVERVPIAKLLLSDSLRLLGVSAERIWVLSQSDVDLPPILVHRSTMRVIDGTHRLCAAALRGDDDIDVRFLDGSTPDVFGVAAQMDPKHALPLIRAELNAAATRVIHSNPHWSDALIAAFEGLSPKTVGVIRRRLGDDLAQSSVRIGRDDQVRPVGTAYVRPCAQEFTRADPEVTLSRVAEEPGAGTADMRAVASFVDRIFADLPRADQRNRAREYMTGLLATPGKKSLRRMAEVVSASPRTSHALQQFLNDSPWDWRPVRRALAHWVAERSSVSSWTIAVAELPKRGNHSVGVHQHYSEETRRTLNCQLGVGLFSDGEGLSVPVDWRLVLPGRWRTDPGLRESVRIPDEFEPQSAEGCVLDLLRSRLEDNGQHRPPFVVDLTRLPQGGELLDHLAASYQGFVARVPYGTPVYPAGGSERPVPASRLVRRASLPGGADRAIPRGHGPHRVRTCSVRLTPDGPPHRLVLGQQVRPQEAPHAVVTNLVHGKPAEILRLAGATARARAALRSMQRDSGLRDFEGRSYPGWHHHMTLVSAAHAFQLLGDAVPAARRTSELVHVA